MRKIAVAVHRYLGLALGLFLLVSGLSGSLLVFEREIDAALNPALLKVAIPPTAATAAPAMELDTLLQNARQAVPDRTPRFVFMPPAAGDAAEVMFHPESIRLHADPYTGAILGQRHPTESFTGFLTDLHIHLLAGHTGEQVMGWAGMGALALCGLGVVLWWPRPGGWKRAFSVKWHAAAFRVWFDTHRVAGAASVAFILVTALTGTALALYEVVTEPALIAITGEGTRRPPPKSTLHDASPASAAPIDAMLARAASLYPAGRITRITLPLKPAEAVAIRMRQDGEIHQFGRTFLWFDQYNGNLLRVDDALQANTAARIQSWLYPLHTGTYGGLLTQCLQVLVGLALSFLTASGIWMWIKRTRAKATVAARRDNGVRIPDGGFSEPR